MELQNESKTASKRGFWLLSMWDSPAMRAVCAAITIIGLPLSFFIGRWTEARPGLTVYNLGSRIAVANPTKLPSFEIESQGQKITDAVWFVDFAIWNQGRAPIAAADTLRSVGITLGDKAKIYNSAILTTSRPECGLSTVPAGNTGAVVTWKILEEGDGGIVRITYSGTSDPRIDGSLVGQRSIPISEKGRSVLISENQLLVVFYLVVLIGFFKAMDFVIDRIRWRVVRRVVAFAALLIALPIGAAVIKAALRLNTPTPPFSAGEEQFVGRDH